MQISVRRHSRWSAFSSLFQQRTVEERETVRNLKELVGERRLERIFSRPELSLNVKLLRSDKLCLTKAIAHKLLVGLSDIRLDDLEELAAAQSLDLKTLGISQLDQLYGSLLPKLKLKSFCRSVPLYDRAETSGKGFKGLQERVWTILKARKRAIKNRLSPNQAQIAEIEMLTSRLADREPPQGSLVRCKDAYFVVDRVIARGGACLRIYRELSLHPRTLLICRGMAARRSATGALLSLLNGIGKRIGLLGIEKSWGEVKKYLGEKRIHQIDILGKSLGGGHAQYLSALILAKTNVDVRSLSTFCSIGIPENVQTLFDNALQRGKRKPDIVIVRNGADYVPLLGGLHLHTPDTTRLYYVSADPFLSPAELIPKGEGLLKSIKKFFHSFGQTHLLQNSLRTQFYFSEPVNLFKEIHCHRLEPIRFRIAQGVHLAALGLFNPRQNLIAR